MPYWLAVTLVGLFLATWAGFVLLIFAALVKFVFGTL